MLAKISQIVWGLPTIGAILGTGLYLTYKLDVIQIFELGPALKALLTPKTRESGEITPAKALMTALSATIGTGNIAGVATALTLGGPGAIFWMWLTALIGMATKYSEAYFAVKFREQNSEHEYCGGPMYYIKNGLGPKWRHLAMAFAVFGGIAGFGIGNAVQANAVAKTLHNIMHIPEIYTGLAIAFIAACVLIGGISRIANFAGRVVPFMSITYFLVALFCLWQHSNQIIPTIEHIFTNAFSANSVSGGIAGTGVIMSMRMGIARGIFSNEAGLGSAAIAHAAAKTNDPKSQGLIAMLGVMIDTIIICTITALVILTSGVTGLNGSLLTEAAVSQSLPHGGDIVGICLVFFAFTSIIGWSYYSERCLVFIFGSKVKNIFRLLWVLVIPIGAVIQLDLVWLIADIFNALMAYPNLIALILLAKRFY